MKNEQQIREKLLKGIAIYRQHDEKEVNESNPVLHAAMLQTMKVLAWVLDTQLPDDIDNEQHDKLESLIQKGQKP